VSWKHTLSETLKDKHGSELRTIADARAYVLALPDHLSGRQHWQHAAKLMLVASRGGDTVACTKQITLALLMDGLLCMPPSSKRNAK
jgi:hypothetical protein